MTAKTVTQVHQERRQPVSFEVFPPKGDLAQEDAVTLASQLAPLDPAYISVTYSAGGSGNKRATCDVASLIQRDYGVTAVAHLTCQGLLREQVAGVAQTLKDAGVVNVLALRGDPVPGEQGDLAHASDLIPLLAEQGLCVGAAAYPEGHVGVVNVLALRGDPVPGEQGDLAHASDLIPLLAEQGLCVGAAAYPEGHVGCLDLDEDVKHVREKQDAGAEFLVTQLFFDNEVAYRFQDKAEKAGIRVPISYGVMPFLSKSQVSRMIFMCGASLPSKVIKLLARYEDDPVSLRKAGIEYAVMPFLSKSQVSRMIFMCGASLPSKVIKLLARYEDDPVSLRKAGIEYACDQLVDLKRHGVDGLHVYIMNRPSVAQAAMEALARA